jgi:hypothetical protein
VHSVKDESRPALGTPGYGHYHYSRTWRICQQPVERVFKNISVT